MASDKVTDNYVQRAIPCFDSHYDHWSVLMENFLRSKEHWTLVETGIVKLESGVVLTKIQQKKLEESKLKDLKEKNYLFQAIDCSILEPIPQKDTSKQIWDSMKKKYQGSTKQKVMVVVVEDMVAAVAMEEVESLKSNLLSLGQLHEKGYEIKIIGGACQIHDQNRGLIAKAYMTTNRIFSLHIQSDGTTYFSAKVNGPAWLWHLCYGHLKFRSLKTLHDKEMVTGLPQITCPTEDICGAITPASNARKRSPTFAVRDLTLEEAWSGREPAVGYFKVFGCIAYAHIPDEKRKKLDDKGEKCVFLGI
ncbi:hypothetical protein L3X38_011213 [Prunus dulcis]|uniref:GAG-pre-integrase domain-containing protein n=1 Tax=Prunus dulcis TaxID=3755 RepID=A0AAD4WJS1_PRUDU|nr:hypothetical protein L3X38_011213 [Prunus dulcis]